MEVENMRKVVELKPREECVVVYWQDFADEFERKGGAEGRKEKDKEREIERKKLIEKAGLDGMEEEEGEGEELGEDSDEEEEEEETMVTEKKKKKGAKGGEEKMMGLDEMPESIVSDPFFARLLKNAENYGKPEKGKRGIKRGMGGGGGNGENEYDFNDPFIDDSELTYMDGHHHSYLGRDKIGKKKRLMVIGMKGKGDDGGENAEGGKEGTMEGDIEEGEGEGKTVLDLGEMDRANKEDFFVYYGALESDEEKKECSNEEDTLKGRENGKERRKKEEEGEREKEKGRGKEENRNLEELEEIREKEKTSKTAYMSSSISLSSSIAIGAVGGMQQMQNLRASERLEQALRDLEVQVVPGVITDKRHFPFALKEPLKRVCVCAMEQTLDYEKCLLEKYPLPERFRDKEYYKIHGETIASGGNQVQHDNAILQWEPSIDLVDVCNVYEQLSRFMPWNKSTMRKIVAKLLVKDTHAWKMKQVLLIEHCMRRKIKESILASTSFVWTTPLRHLLHQYMRVYLEMHGLVVNPIANEQPTGEERAKLLKCRRDAYLRLVELWPKDTMNISIISRIYSIRKSLVATRIRRTLGSSTPAAITGPIPQKPTAVNSTSGSGSDGVSGKLVPPKLVNLVDKT